MVKGLYIARHNEVVATAGKAIMDGVKGGCLAVLMADAGWHGKITGLSVQSRIRSQVLRDVQESMLRRMRPDMLLIEKNTGDNVLPTLYDLEHPRHRRCCKVHVVEVGFCAEVAYAQKYKEKYEQHCAMRSVRSSQKCWVFRRPAAPAHLWKHRRHVQAHSTASEEIGCFPLKSGQFIAGYALGSPQKA